MAKKLKKKRSKAYRGQDAASRPGPQVIRMEAANRSKLGQWWFEKKKFTRPALIVAALLFGVSWLVFELLRAIFQW